MRESKESKQRHKNKSNNRVKSNESTLEKHENTGQFKKIFTLVEDVLKNIQEIKKKKRDMNNNDKLDLAKIEQILIEIDFDFLDILNNYADNIDKQDNADNIDQNTDSLNFNFDLDQDESDQQNIFEE